MMRMRGQAVEMGSKVKNAWKDKRENVAKATYEEMKVEQKEVERREPVDTGAMLRTTTTTKPEWHGNVVHCDIRVGGAEAPYAPYVHEDLEAYHRVGQAKFLESVLLESRPYIGERIARRARSMR